MQDSQLYIKLRKRLKRGEPFVKARAELLRQGYSRKKIESALKEFFKDEKTKYDDTLIKEIEKRLRKGELLQEIIDSLVKKGHKPFEVEKALMRASTTPSKKLYEVFKGWEWYSYVQILILFITVILGIFYTPWFFLSTLFMLIEMGLSFAEVPSLYKNWIADVNVLPGMGVWVTQGYFGYSSTCGNYFRWWVIEPSLALFGFFLIFGAVFGLAAYGWTFFFVCLLLGLASLVSFKYKPKAY